MGAEGTHFNEKVFNDIICIERLTVLYIEDYAELFSAAQFDKPITTEARWETIPTLR